MGFGTGADATELGDARDSIGIRSRSETVFERPWVRAGGGKRRFWVGLEDILLGGRGDRGSGCCILEGAAGRGGLGGALTESGRGGGSIGCNLAEGSLAASVKGLGATFPFISDSRWTRLLIVAG